MCEVSIWPKSNVVNLKLNSIHWTTDQATNSNVLFISIIISNNFTSFLLDHRGTIQINVFRCACPSFILFFIILELFWVWMHLFESFDHETKNQANWIFKVTNLLSLIVGTQYILLFFKLKQDSLILTDS